MNLYSAGSIKMLTDAVKYEQHFLAFSHVVC